MILCFRFEGKSNNNPMVGALMTPDCIKGVEALISKRTMFNISDENIYVFGRQGSENTHFEGYHSIREIIELSGVPNPSLYMSCKLRKYVATELRWMNT